MVLLMKQNELMEIISPAVALLLQLVQALAQAIGEVIAGLLKAGMGV